MLLPVRCVVTGHDDEGRSVIISDGTAADTAERPDWPGRGTTHLWRSGTLPVDNRLHAALPLGIFPLAGGTSFIISQIPPEAELAAMPADRRERVAGQAARHTVGLSAGDTSRHPGMHATDTLDYIVIVSGEITMLLDKEEITLRPGDVLVQRGTAHAWINRGTQTVVMASIIVDALPLS